jgi:uracil-DNA glycosylase
MTDEVRRYRSLKALFADMDDCTRCPLALSRTHVVHGVGNSKASLMLIGEAPGEKEDLAGTPFVGASGRLLDSLLQGSGIERHDVFITNIVACRPPKNRTPKVVEVKAHAPWIEEQLRLLKPKLIVTLGRVALTYFIPKAKVTLIRGTPQKVTWGSSVLTIVPTLHPAAALRDPERRPLLQADFKKISKLLSKL